MSIINNALKKTQAKLEEKIQTGIPSEKNKRNLLTLIAAIIALAGFLGCGIALIYIISRESPSKTVQVKETTQVSTPLKTAPKKQVMPKEHKEIVPSAEKPNVSQAGLSLSGVIVMKDDQFAFINDQIVRVGDYIEGKRVVSISVNQVKLEDNGKIITLKTKQQLY